jgi:curli biogenesis system outer membrane secretion channel CsgG
MVIRSRARFRLALHFLMLAVVTAGSASAVAAGEKEMQLPACDKSFGTLSVVEPEQKWWLQYNLESPEALIKVFVSQCKCFKLVDRGRGLEAAMKERELAAGGDLNGESNIGKGQIKAADYVLIPDIVSQNANASGKSIGGAFGGLLGRRAGGLGVVLGGVSLKKKTADVVLTLTDVRSTEEVAVVKGHAKKTNVGWGAGGGAFWGGFAAAGASSYANTEIGQVVAMAYLDAFTKLVDEVKEAKKDIPDSKADNKADNASQSVTMAKPGRMYEKADAASSTMRNLDVGMMLYPTGDKDGIWWKVSDETGNKGWVSSLLFAMAK